MEGKAKWMESDGPEGDIIISTRVRLARNLSDLPFPGTMDEGQAQKVRERLQRVIDSAEPSGQLSSFILASMSDMSKLDRLVMVEKHLISPDLALANKSQGAVAVRGDQVVSIMVNEEDHLRIQCLLPGLQLEKAYNTACTYDDLLEAQMPFAFHEDYGYLTSCPTNAGTGMRASVMAHLPALVTSGQIGRVLSAIGQFGLMARGLYGEGTQAVGNIFQISNQVTSGLTEEEILNNLSAAVEKIVAQERSVLQGFRNKNGVKLEDKVFRALGTLQRARILSSNEAMALLSDVRLGVSAGFLNLPPGVFSELMVLTQPGSLQKAAGKPLDMSERDVKRATLVRDKLNSITEEVK